MPAQDAKHSKQGAQHARKHSNQFLKKSNIIEYSANSKAQPIANEYQDQSVSDLVELNQQPSRIVTSSSANIYSSDKKNVGTAGEASKHHARIPYNCQSPQEPKERWQHQQMCSSESANIPDLSHNKDRNRMTNNFLSEYLCLMNEK